MTTIADSQVELAAPTGREEAWRFTPLRQLRGIHDHLDVPTQANIATQIADGVRFDVVDTASCAPTSGPTDWASSLARAATNQSAVVTIPREFETAEPTVLTISGSGVEVTTVGHIVIKAEAFSKAVVVIEHTGSATYSENVDVYVGDGAQLTVLTVQAWNDDTVHLARQHAVVGRDASYRSFVASFGGHVVRIVPTVEYTAPGGSAELLGAFFADAGQHLEHRSLVDHSVPNCRSNVMYKGALKGDPDLGPAGVAHTVWVGDVIIRAAAVGTETYEVNRNLVLTDAARAELIGGVGSNGLRVPNDEQLVARLRLTGPLAVSSANEHGSPPATSAVMAMSGVGRRADIIWDGGRRGGDVSTVVDLTGVFVIRREGALTREQIVNCLAR